MSSETNDHISNKNLGFIWGRRFVTPICLNIGFLIVSSLTMLLAEEATEIISLKRGRLWETYFKFKI